MPSSLVEWRVFVAGVANPAATPFFVGIWDRDGNALPPASWPVIAHLGNAKFVFEPDDALLATGYAFLIDNGATADARYFFDSFYASGVLPIAALCFFDGTGALYSGVGSPSVSAPDYVTPDSVVRTAQPLVALARPYFWALSPSQEDVDAGGVAYVVLPPAGAYPESYDGSFSGNTGWTYDPSVASDVDKVRLLIGDTNPADRLLTDSEILFFLELRGGDVFKAAADAAKAVAARFSRLADTTNLSLSIAASQRAEAYWKLASELDTRADLLGGSEMFVGGLSVSGKESLDEDTDAVQPSFRIGQDDEPGTLPPTRTS